MLTCSRVITVIKISSYLFFFETEKRYVKNVPELWIISGFAQQDYEIKIIKNNETQELKMRKTQMFRWTGTTTEDKTQLRCKNQSF